MCNCSNRGVEQTLNKSQQTKLTLEKKIPARIWTHNLSITILPLYQQAIPAPQSDHKTTTKRSECNNHMSEQKLAPPCTNHQNVQLTLSHSKMKHINVVTVKRCVNSNRCVTVVYLVKGCGSHHRGEGQPVLQQHDEGRQQQITFSTPDQVSNKFAVLSILYL